MTEEHTDMHGDEQGMQGSGEQTPDTSPRTAKLPDDAQPAELFHPAEGSQHTDRARHAEGVPNAETEAPQPESILAPEDLSTTTPERLPDWLDESRPTPAILTLVLLNIVIFASMTAAAIFEATHSQNIVFDWQTMLAILISIPTDTLLHWGANATPVTILDHQYWRLLSNTFLHQNLLHLAMNMYVLWDFNRLLERLYGSPKFVTIYLISGLGSSICSLLFLAPTDISAGASGAIFGAFGATVAFFWSFKKDFPKRYFRMYQKMFFVFLIYCVVSACMFPGMDNAAHLGGFLVGLWAALCLLPSGVASRSWAKGNFLKLACLTLVLVCGLELAIRMQRDNPEVKGEREYQQAIKLLKSEHFEDALEQLEKASKIEPNNAAIYADEAMAYGKLKRFEQAREAAGHALQADPKNKKALMARGSSYHSLGLEEQAVDAASEFIRLYPKEAIAYNNRAWSYNALNQPDLAITDATRAMRLDNFQASWAYDTRAVAYCLKHQYAEALDDLQEYIKRKPKEGSGYYHRGYVYWKTSRMEEAKADYALARKLKYVPDPWEGKLFDFHG
jgi:membrane associated rhomboid family serine protease/Flp pilus assembly protein TadD